MAIPSNWQLPAQLCTLSQIQTWPAALQEWRVECIEKLAPDEPAKTCLCLHTPIRNVCHISNHENDNTAILGTTCVNKLAKQSQWQDKDTHKIFAAYKRIKKDLSQSANKALIAYAYKHQAISEEDYRFYLEILHKKKFSNHQQDRKQRLNQAIITSIANKTKLPVAASSSSSSNLIMPRIGISSKPVVTSSSSNSNLIMPRIGISSKPVAASSSSSSNLIMPRIATKLPPVSIGTSSITS